MVICRDCRPDLPVSETIALSGPAPSHRIDSWIVVGIRVFRNRKSVVWFRGFRRSTGDGGGRHSWFHCRILDRHQTQCCARTGSFSPRGRGILERQEVIWVQQVDIVYTKASRGAPQATVRNRLPRAFAILGSGDDAFYFEHYK